VFAVPAMHAMHSMFESYDSQTIIITNGISRRGLEGIRVAGDRLRARARARADYTSRRSCVTRRDSKARPSLRVFSQDVKRRSNELFLELANFRDRVKSERSRQLGASHRASKLRRDSRSFLSFLAIRSRAYDSAPSRKVFTRLSYAVTPSMPRTMVSRMLSALLNRRLSGGGEAPHPSTRILSSHTSHSR